MRNPELNTPPVIEITQRRFTVVLSESQAAALVERLKFRQHHVPDLTEPVWTKLEEALGYDVTEAPE